MREFEEYALANGIRLIHRRVKNTKVAHCGFHLDIGSRDEKPHQQGLAHFWEHMAFKGTRRRKAYHILDKLDSVGGELNAFTTKEKICFYASFLTDYFPKAFDLLSDITFDSVFPEQQIERERSVILEEMAMYKDSPEDALQDDFDYLIFKGHSLGNNILGTTESVKSFHRENFKEFIAENIDTDRIIFSSVGDIPFSKIKRLASKHLEHIPVHTSENERQPYDIYKSRKLQIEKSITQSHCAIGGKAYSLTDDKRLPFFLMTNLLGGPGMNSRLNLALRERLGYVYGIDAQYSSFTDVGMFGIYFGTDPSQLLKSRRVVMKELKSLKEKPLGRMQLHKAKEQLMGQLAMAEENNLSFMLMMGKSMLDLGKIQSLDEIFNRIRSIKSTDLMDIANEMFDENNLSVLTYLPKN
jgi:predicted Zn-dependent peptidase